MGKVRKSLKKKAIRQKAVDASVTVDEGDWEEMIPGLYLREYGNWYRWIPEANDFDMVNDSYEIEFLNGVWEEFDDEIRAGRLAPLQNFSITGEEAQPMDIETPHMPNEEFDMGPMDIETPYDMSAPKKKKQQRRRKRSSKKILKRKHRR